MNEHSRQLAFLKHLLGYDNSQASQELREQLDVAQRNERCVTAACRLVALIGAAGLAGFGYTAVLLPEFFENSSHVLIKVFGALSLGSGFCLVVFIAVALWYRFAANKVRENCRQAIVATLDPRLRSVADREKPVIRHAPYPPAGWSHPGSSSTSSASGRGDTESRRAA